MNPLNTKQEQELITYLKKVSTRADKKKYYEQSDMWNEMVGYLIQKVGVPLDSLVEHAEFYKNIFQQTWEEFYHQKD